MGEADVRVAVGGVLAALREAGRSEGTIRRHQVVLDRFAAFLAGRGLVTACDQVCVDFIANQTGTRLGALRESVRDRDVKAVRRPVVLMADALAGRAVVIDQSVIPAKDGCPARFRALRDDYVASCRARGNAEATVAAKDKAVSRFLGYLDEAGAGDLAALSVRDVSGFLLRQRGLRRKTIAVVQHKTGRPLSLPLLDDVGWAIIDYVRHGRPETACAKVFIKHRHPFDAFGCSSSVACRLSRHAARAGIEFPPGQACGMHSLRGALAVAMIGNGAPMPVISAVLGHASSDTTQAYYLRFDVERLRCCALDVEDVAGQAGAGERGA